MKNKFSIFKQWFGDAGKRTPPAAPGYAACFMIVRKKNMAAIYPEKVAAMAKAWQQRANELHALAEQDLASKGAGKKQITAKEKVVHEDD